MLKNKSIFLLVLFFTAVIIFFQNCSQNLLASKSTITTSPVAVNDSEEDKKDVVQKSFFEDYDEISYYRGGWFGAPDTPNWSHDFKLEIKTGHLNSFLGDRLCGGILEISKEEIAALKTEFDAAVLQNAPDEVISAVDAGSERIHLRKFNSATHELEKEISISLSRMTLEPGELFVVQPEKLSAAMKALVDNKIFDAVYCQ